MSGNAFSFKKLLVLSACAFVVAGAMAPVAEARGREANAKVQTKRGEVNAQSKVARGNGTKTRDVTITGPNGGQQTVHQERVIDKDAGTASSSYTRTFGDGTSRNVEKDVVKTGEGSYSVNRVATGRNGEVREQSGNVNIVKTENGRDISKEITTEKGVITQEKSITN